VARHTGELVLNEFELALVSRLLPEIPGVVPNPRDLRVRARSFTDTSSLTIFELPNEVGYGQRGHVGPLEIAMPGMPDGLWAVLFTVEGKPACLEISTFKDMPWDGTYAGYVIVGDA
jgi:hypothetical protein